MGRGLEAPKRLKTVKIRENEKGAVPGAGASLTPHANDYAKSGSAVLHGYVVATIWPLATLARVLRGRTGDVAVRLLTSTSAVRVQGLCHRGRGVTGAMRAGIQQADTQDGFWSGGLDLRRRSVPNMAGDLRVNPTEMGCDLDCRDARALVRADGRGRGYKRCKPSTRCRGGAPTPLPSDEPPNVSTSQLLGSRAIEALEAGSGPRTWSSCAARARLCLLLNQCNAIDTLGALRGPATR